MVEGVLEYDPTAENENPVLDSKIDNDDDDEEEVVDTTRPFQPGAASDPYHGGEEYEMSRMDTEQSGLDDTTSLLQPQENQSWAYVKALFSDADPIKLETFMEEDPNPDPKSNKKN